MIDLAAHGTDIERHEAFRAALLAFAYPGKPQRAELADMNPERLARLVVAALVDPGQSSSTSSDEAVVLRVGTLDADELLAFSRGTEERPEAGASVVFVPHDVASVVRVRLSGPGIESSRSCALALDRDALAARARVCAIEPLGIDLLIVDVAGITGVPRTTRVEVLD